MGRSSKGYLTTAAAAAAVSALFGSGAARAAEPTTAELMQQIDQLKAKVQQLETTQNQQATLSAKQVDATVERVLNDAEKRSQLLQVEGFTAGYNKGRFTIQDAAGNWMLRPTFQFQLRAVGNIRDGGDGSDSDKQKGFEIPRMKFGFDGNAFSPSFTYNFLWNSATNGGSVGLEQAWVRYAFNDQMAIRAGQIINPVFREQSIGSRKQLAVERSMMNTLITGTGEGRTQVAELQFDPTSQISIEIGAEDGFNSQNTDFTDPSSGGANDWGAFGRVNFFAMGPRSEWDDFSAMKNKEDLLVIGGGLDVTQTGSNTVYLHTVDAQYENTGGLGIYGAYAGSYTDLGSGDDDSLYNWGFLVQAGYMLNDSWELFGRWDYTKFDSDSSFASGADEYCEVTLGTNWYVGGGHNAKFTFDFVYLPNGSPADIKSADILASSDAEYIFRGQFQLLL